jgi:hypothetical protein
VEHARRFDGIQSGHAANAGRLLEQYSRFAAKQTAADRYDATLTICVLHALLTQCAELMKYTQLAALPDLQEPLTEQPNSLGLTTSVVVQDTFPEPLTGEGLLVHLRDALSHPAPDEDFRFRPTGFTSTNDPSGSIRGYVFTSSPWIKDDQRQPFGQKLPRATEKAARGIVTRFCKGNRAGFALDVLTLGDGKFDVGHRGQPYVPLLVATVPLDLLVGITSTLAEHLSRRGQQVPS